MKCYFLRVLLCVMAFAAIQPVSAVVTINTVAEDGTINAWYKIGSTWTAIATVELGTTSRRITAGDGMANGGNDLYVATTAGAYRVYATSAGASLTSGLVSSTAIPADLGGGFEVCIGDTDNDSNSEVVMGDQYGVRTHIWDSNSGTWSRRKVKDTGGDLVRAIAIGDTDADGKNEVCMSWNAIGLAAAYEYNGSSYVEDYRGVNLNQLPWRVAGGDVDINGDGVKDFAIAAIQHVARHDFAAGHTLQIIHTNGAQNTDVAIGNADGDAYVDIISVTNPEGLVLNYEYTTPTTHTETQIIGFSDPYQGAHTAVELYDIDSDGLDEVIAVSYDGYNNDVNAPVPGQIRLYDYNTGSGTWSFQVLANTNEHLMDVVISDVGVQCGGLLPADLNGDCYIKFDDFALFAGDWLKCTDLTNPNCTP